MGSVAVVAIAAGVPSWPASAQVHPREDVYAYRVKDFALQPPWHSYPEEREREQWDCFDSSTRIVVNCAMASRPPDQYRFIFQRDINKLRFLRPGDDRSVSGVY